MKMKKFVIHNSIEYPTMENCSSFKQRIHLNEETKKRLKNFIFDSSGEDESSLCYVVLEGNCVLTTISRASLIGKPNELRFGIYRYFSDENGHMREYFDWMPRKECLAYIKKYVSSDGAPAIEDSTGKTHLLCLNALKHYWDIRGDDSDDESETRLIFPSDLSLSNLRNAMKSALNHGNSLNNR